MAALKAKRKQPPRMRDEHRGWVITQFAHHRREDEITQSFVEHFGFNPPKNSVHSLGLIRQTFMDRAKAEKANVGKWVDLFIYERKQFMDSVEHIPVASPVYRLAQLDQMYTQAIGRQNWRTAAQLLEQASRETGGRVTKAGTPTHPDSGSKPVPLDTRRGAITEYIRTKIADLVSGKLAE